MRPAKPGDPIEQHLTTRVFNSLVKKQGMKPNDLTKLKPLVPVTFMGHSTSTIGMYEPVKVIGPMLPNPDLNVLEYNEYYRYPQCVISKSIDNFRWAVTQAPIGDGTPGLCIVQGLTWVKANVSNLAHNWLTVDTDGESLKSSEAKGKALIITPPEETGVGYCLVLLGIMPTATQTFITQIRVAAGSVQYKERTIYVWPESDESEWLFLPSVECE